MCINQKKSDRLVFIIAKDFHIDMKIILNIMHLQEKQQVRKFKQENHQYKRVLLYTYNRERNNKEEVVSVLNVVVGQYFKEIQQGLDSMFIIKLKKLKLKY
jgi:hypothetical protein